MINFGYFLYKFFVFFVRIFVCFAKIRKVRWGNENKRWRENDATKYG